VAGMVLYPIIFVSQYNIVIPKFTCFN